MYLGIEIGGTKLQLGIGPGDGTLAGLWRGTVDPASGADGIRRQIMAAVPELLARSGTANSLIKGAGVGFGGPVDDATRTVIKSHQIVGWDGFPLADWMSEILGKPVVLGNDADVAGLGEASFGAGKGLSPVFYITIGSGVGGGLIIDGEIYRGCGKGAAEVGHLLIHAASEVFGPGSTDRTSEPTTLEAIASGWGIEKHARAIYSDETITAADVARAAATGDPRAQQILRRAWDALAEAIRHVVVLLCPRRIVIGGGVSLMGETLFFEPLRELVAARMFPPFAGCCDIVPAALGEEVVVHGALALARQRLGGRGSLVSR
jgi:glucokinase